MSTNHENGRFDFSGLFILEMANNHQGDVLHGKAIIKAFEPIVRKAGVRAAIKFQLRDLDTFIHPDFKKSAEYKHIPRFLSTELQKKDFQSLVQAVHDAGMIAMATPSDETSVDTAVKLGVNVLKIASASATDWPLLERIAAAGKPVVCSTCGLALYEVDNLVSFFKHRGVDFALMHCVAIYPTSRHKLNLKRIEMMVRRYPEIAIGFSTHEAPEETNIMRVAYALGARLFEKHIGLPTEKITLNAYSANPEQFAAWLDAYSDTIAVIGSGVVDKDDREEVEGLRLQMRGVYAKKAIKKGEKLARSSVFFAMPLQEGQLSSGQWKASLVVDRAYTAKKPISKQVVAKQYPSKKEIVYRALHEIKGMLNEANIPVNNDSSVTILYPEGAADFFETGAVRINCINERYVKRIIVLLPGQAYPASYHKRRDLTLQVLWGEPEIQIEKRRKLLYSGETALIPAGTWYALAAPHGAVFEELSLAAEFEETVFIDKDIEALAPELRETKLVHWGRHQFDDEK